MRQSTYADHDIENLDRYRRKGSLTMRKLAEYIPVMIVTNISLLLINTIDRIVAGNFIGTDAMNSISIFYPVLLLTTVFSGPVASGIATSISNAMGKNDMDELAHAKTAGLRLMILTAVIVAAVQIPIVLGVIKSYDLSEELSSMIWQYAIGCMICTPLAIVSTVGTYQMQISGRMKVIMVLTMLEGALNLAFDLWFVAGFDMGVAGTGYGTACANLVRCVCTIVYMKKFTDFYKGDGKPVIAKDLRCLISLGLPDAAFILMLAFQNYFVLRIILYTFGEDGGVIYGLCAFCLSIINTLLFGIQGGMRPLMGLFSGADDKQGLKELMRQGILNVIAYAGVTTAVIMIFPEFFYHIHGVDNIPEGGALSVRLFAAAFIIRGFDYILRLYFANRKDIKFATALTVVGNATLPLFAFIIANVSTSAPYIFLAYLFTELLIFALSLKRYLRFRSADMEEKPGVVTLYMTVARDEAVEASQYIRKFAHEHGIDKRISYRAALCMEEMVAYIKEADAFSLIPHSDLTVDIIVKFEDKHSAIFTTLDDGAFIALDKDEEKQELITDNYGLIKKIAKSVEYQYVLNMNYTKITLG